MDEAIHLPGFSTAPICFQDSNEPWIVSPHGLRELEGLLDGILVSTAPEHLQHLLFQAIEAALEWIAEDG